MRKIKVFLASSKELIGDRKSFKEEIGSKNKIWHDAGIFLDLDIWEDLSARMSDTRLQDEYNKKVREADLFVLLAYSKVGMYTEEEFEQAFGQFKETQKPFIFTYFKEPPPENTEESLAAFHRKLKNLGHFIHRIATLTISGTSSTKK